MRLSRVSCASHLARGMRSVHTRPQPLHLQSESPLIRPHNVASSSSSSSAVIAKPNDFLLWPEFFNVEETKALLQMALWKLDRVDSSLKRRRKGKDTPKSLTTSSVEADELQSLFNRQYGFKEGHYDSVIHRYRETLLSSLPPSPSSTLVSSLSKLYSLLPRRQEHQSQSISTEVDADLENLPPQGTITHLLHLSPEGEILPHVDNLEASGSVICGVSLGAERTLRLQHKDRKNEGWDVRLNSGSVYLQR
nr:uncharacterized protein I303_03142 [Kwoniella dejecticola CBS 10117]OBR87118.1 hypothetical protein I303_03142 [Kwoniella dejecticola CBS 10117]